MKELMPWPTGFQSRGNPLSDAGEHTSGLLASCKLQPPSTEGLTSAGGSASRVAPSHGCSEDLSVLLAVSRKTQDFDTWAS